MNYLHTTLPLIIIVIYAAIDLHLVDAWFEPWFGYRLPALRIFVLFLNISMQMLGEYLEIGHYRLPNRSVYVTSDPLTLSKFGNCNSIVRFEASTAVTMMIIIFL
jgi:hypothetical protein